MSGLHQLALRTAIVTGGGRGIGRPVALAYAREGADDGGRFVPGVFVRPPARALK